MLQGAQQCASRPKQELVALVLATAPHSRLADLGLDGSALIAWADLSFCLCNIAVDYTPSGSVSALDIFHAEPLRAAAKSREDWVNNHLSKWRDFCSGEVRFHQVPGQHYTMLSPEHVVEFSQTLKKALEGRGL